MKIDDYLVQALAIVQSCKEGSMNADACLAQLETLNEEQASDHGPMLEANLEDFTEVENTEVEVEDYVIPGITFDDEECN